MKVKAKEFIKKYGIKKLNSHVLRAIIGKMGYDVSEFDGAGDISELHRIPDCCPAGIKGFTCMSDKRVYIHSELTDDEKVIVLAHECGHIFFEHECAFTFDAEVKAEYDANEFAHYLINEVKKKQILKPVAAVLIIAAVIGLALTVCFAFFCNGNKNEPEFGEYYITKTGYKYHSRSCPRIIGKSGVEQITLEQFESGMYEPCGSCKPLK